MPEATPAADFSIDGLAAVPVLGLDGTSLRLGDLWRGQATVLLFLRHFG